MYADTVSHCDTREQSCWLDTHDWHCFGGREGVESPRWLSKAPVHDEEDDNVSAEGSSAGIAWRG